jgi:hypothetical protein
LSWGEYAEKVWKYLLRGTTTQALCFGGSNIVLQGYVDLDMVGDIDIGGAPQGMFLL